MATYKAENGVTTLSGKGVRSMRMPRRALYDLMELNASQLGDELMETLEEMHRLSKKNVAALVILIDPEGSDEYP